MDRAGLEPQASDDLELEQQLHLDKLEMDRLEAPEPWLASEDLEAPEMDKRLARIDDGGSYYTGLRLTPLCFVSREPALCICKSTLHCQS